MALGRLFVVTQPPQCAKDSHTTRLAAKSGWQPPPNLLAKHELCWAAADQSRWFGTAVIVCTASLLSARSPLGKRSPRRQRRCLRKVGMAQRGPEIPLVGGSHLLEERAAVMQEIEPWVKQDILRYLGDPRTNWQPMDFVPDPTCPEFLDQLQEFRKESSGLSDSLLITLVGDMVTEEALPTYQTMLNRFTGAADLNGTDESAWGVWGRAWTAEENRHGDLLNRYLYLTGRVDMRQVEVTIQSLIAAGMQPHINRDPYRGFIYTSFQERATKISHGRVAGLAGQEGDKNLQQICAKIAGDEARHERAYTAIAAKCFEVDPDGAMMAFADMMRAGIVMPAHLMTDCTEGMGELILGRETRLFADYARVAESVGVYTADDYISIFEHLVATWDIAKMKCQSAEAMKAQSFILKFGPRFKKIVERRKVRATSPPGPMHFSWLPPS